MTALEHPVSQEELMAFVDGELPHDRAAIVDAHVSGCVVCQRLGRDLRAVSRDVARWQVEPPPETLQAPVVRPKRTSFVFSLSPARAVQFAAVAIVGLLIGGTALMTRSTRTPPLSLAAPARPAIGGAPRFEPALPPPPHPGAPGQTSNVPAAISPQPSPPLVARTARLRLITKNMQAVRSGLDRIVADLGGLVGQIDASEGEEGSKSLTATLLIPTERFDASLQALRALGTVLEESRGGEDVTEQTRDLEARLSNSRSTEKRLIELLSKRTGDLADVLAAEREVARVREEIERLEADRKRLERRVTYATIALVVQEERKSSLELGPMPVSTRFRNAFIDGFRTAFASALEAALILLQVGPMLVLWAIVLVFPIRVLSRRFRHSALHSPGVER